MLSDTICELSALPTKPWEVKAQSSAYSDGLLIPVESDSFFNVTYVDRHVIKPL